ncbi:hypothetical protein A0H81_09193 [Grifola frondosa]|uniref:BTB domain-containing protein n=1 Tax=Grifola frondosa TaxID=5627 RepID=A0A1C7M1M7_GRIFR|nr:hypothetical protein A0H81_09193 [Grifola frondosa]
MSDSETLSDTTQSAHPDFLHSFNDADADIIVRSSDDIEFRLYKVVLAKASPIFKALSASTQQTGDGDQSAAAFPEGLPVITVSEDGQIFENLMRLCYPVEQPHFDRLDDAAGVMEAAKKYGMTPVLVRMKDSLMSFIEREPLRIFALAYRWRLEDVARKAATQFLGHSLRSLPPSMPAEFHHLLIPSDTYYNLQAYHRRCMDFAVSHTVSLEWVLSVRGHKVKKAFRKGGKPWLDVSSSWIWFSCKSRDCEVDRTGIAITMGECKGTFRPKVWWMDYIRRARQELENRPVGRAVKGPAMLEPSLRKAGNCLTCGPAAYQDLMEFSELLAARVDESSAQVNTIRMNDVPV